MSVHFFAVSVHARNTLAAFIRLLCCYVLIMYEGE